MRKYIYFIAAICFMCVFSGRVLASNCPKDLSRDLTKEAYYVKVNYEIIDRSTYKEITIEDAKTTFKIPRYEFNISIYNITDKIYAVVSNNLDDDAIIVHFSNTENGIYTFVDKDYGKIRKYEINIYSADESCIDKKLKTIKLIKPMYNAYSEYTYCKGSSNFYCQKFTKNELNLKGNEDFLSKIKVNNIRRSEETKKEEKKEVKSFLDIIIGNWQMYAGIFAGTIVSSLILLIILKRRKTKKEWEE